MENTPDDYQVPFTHINDQLAILCTKCENYIDIKDIVRHRELHRVLKIFRCSFETKPKTLKQLLRRRRQIINEAIEKASSDSPVPNKVMQKIDWAYETLKNEIKREELGDRVEGMTQVGLKQPVGVSGYSRKLENAGLSFGVCQFQNDSWQIDNQDRFSYNEGSIGETAYGFFGLFDGYGGATAAEKCSLHFEKFLLEELSSSSMDSEANFDDVAEEERTIQRENFVKEAIAKSFRKMDKHLLHGECEKSKHRWSGTSATVCYIENETLYLGNVGDVRTLYVKGDGDAVSLGEDHVLRNKKEKDRVKKSNGSVSIGTKSAFVNGIVSSTRGLGNHGDPKLKSSVICKPKIDVIRMSCDDQFVLSCTAGVWEMFNAEEIMFLLEDIMPDTSGIENLRLHFQSVSSSATTKKQTTCFSDDKAIPRSNPEEDSKGEPGRAQNKCMENETAEEKAAHGDAAEDVMTETGVVEEQKRRVVIDDSAVTCLQRDATAYKESKACFLARALVERLAHASVLAGSRANITATVILFSGCPVSLYLLPNIKRKSIIHKESIKYH
eukprot:gene17769-19544_t